MTWLTISAVALVCIVLRIAIPLLMDGTRLATWLESRLSFAVIPLLAGLTSLQLFISSSRNYTVDARAPAALIGGLVYLKRRSLTTALLTAIVAAALARML